MRISDDPDGDALSVVSRETRVTSRDLGDPSPLREDNLEGVGLGALVGDKDMGVTR